MLYDIYIPIEQYGGVSLYQKAAGRLAARTLRAFQFEGMGWANWHSIYERDIHAVHIAKLPTVNQRKRDKQSFIEAEPGKKSIKEIGTMKGCCLQRKAWSPLARLAGGYLLLQIAAAGQVIRMLYVVGKIVRIQLG